jgi:hypothetical protein
MVVSFIIGSYRDILEQVEHGFEFIGRNALSQLLLNRSSLFRFYDVYKGQKLIRVLTGVPH